MKNKGTWIIAGIVVAFVVLITAICKWRHCTFP